MLCGILPCEELSSRLPALPMKKSLREWLLILLFSPNLELASVESADASTNYN
jgi:hypothetical protein